MQRRATWRWVVGGVALVCAAWVGAGTSARPVSAEPSPGSIRVTARPTPANPATTCLPGRMGMTYETETTSERFVLSVHSSAPRCTPIAATAVAYAMPGNGMTWPQRLVEAQPVRILDAGTIEIAFERTCAATQFDVITGAAPERVAPWAEWHGPLLFPFDVATAFQDPGRDCTAPTTTSVPISTEPTATAPDSGTPITAGPGPSGPGDEVLAVTTVPAAVSGGDIPVDPSRGVPSAPRVAGLALTGATTGILVAAAGLMIVAGLGFVVGSWVRARAQR